VQLPARGAKLHDGGLSAACEQVQPVASCRKSSQIVATVCDLLRAVATVCGLLRINPAKVHHFFRIEGSFKGNPAEVQDFLILGAKLENMMYFCIIFWISSKKLPGNQAKI